MRPHATFIIFDIITLLREQAGAYGSYPYAFLP